MYEGAHFWKHGLNRTFVVLAALLTVDVAIHSIGLWSGLWILPGFISFRLAPYLR
jgi:hypothetical protein